MQLVSGVVQLRPRAMFEAMLRGWRAQQAARGLRQDSIGARERLMRRFGDFTNEFPWNWEPSHVDEVVAVADRRASPGAVDRPCLCSAALAPVQRVPLGRPLGWIAACQKEFGPQVHPVAIVHEWNTIAHLNDYEGESGSAPVHRGRRCSGSLNDADEASGARGAVKA